MVKNTNVQFHHPVFLKKVVCRNFLFFLISDINMNEENKNDTLMFQ